MNKELKKCPFCGGEATWANDDKNWIQCLYCGVETSWFGDEQDAIEVWNARKPIDEIVEKLEKAAKIYRDKAVIELSTEGHTLDYEHFEGKSKAFLNAIEIVKGGGKHDD